MVSLYWLSLRLLMTVIDIFVDLIAYFVIFFDVVLIYPSLI